ncbi:MAG: 50S ribosomal protein L11 methyltransferase [Mariprofundaceae bacterium]|nr:50S ribosomal protein L11 methyltransferase [Mariprofundaceae bacterium]
MPEITCLELRIEGSAVDEHSFLKLAESQHTLGTSIETDYDSNVESHIAWFPLSDQFNLEEQRARLAAGSLLLGAKPEQVKITLLGDDWETAWQKYWKAMPVGERLWVRPSFCEPPSGNRIDIVLDPGMAFGTGTHPTTYLCLEAIERYSLQHVPSSVLDMGAGSGLLAITAGKMGASDIHAIDYDPVSVEASRVNAAINHVQLTSTLGDTPPARTFELVIANILAGPLLGMAEPLASCVEKELILSGLLKSQVALNIRTYEALGLKHLRTCTMGDWACVTFACGAQKGFEDDE